MSALRKTAIYAQIMTILLTFSAINARAETVEYDGMIEPCMVVEIGAPADGIVQKVNVDRSSPVKRGQTLVELESSVERAALEKAKAVSTFDGEIRQLETQLTFAKRVHERIKPLSAISTHDKDQAATEIKLTEHRLKKAYEKHSTAKLELAKARALLAKRSIKSPISGVVVERYVSPGEYVNNQPLLQLAQIDPLRVEVIVPAHMFGKIEPGMTATIVPELQDYGALTATVTIADKVIDSASNTFGVRLQLPNDDLRVPSGLKCLVQFEIEDKVARLK